MTSLKGMRVGISGAIPEPDELRAMGGSELDIHFAVKRLVERVLAAGGDIVYGSHPTFTPIIEAIATQFQTAGAPKRVHTFVARGFFDDAAWKEFRSRHSVYSEVVPVGEVNAMHDSALSQMREQMIAQADTLVCIGGKSHRGDGSPPGVQQEAEFASKRGIPVYLMGCCGGHTRTLFDQDFASKVEALHNRLDEGENYTLAKTDSVWEAVDLVMQGLARESQSKSPLRGDKR